MRDALASLHRIRGSEIMNTQGAPTEVGRYSLLIEWSDADGAYVVTVPELPGCRTHGATHQEAIAMGEEAIEGWLAAQRARGRVAPPPRTYDRYYTEADLPTSAAS